MKNIEILFLDIDGTIRDSNAQISKTTIDSIHQLITANVKVVLCTGRSFKYAKRVIEEIGQIDYLISSNGSEISDIKNDKTIYNFKMNANDINILYEFAKTNNLNFLVNTFEEDYQTIDESYNRVLISSLEEVKDDINQVVVTSYDYDAMFFAVTNFYNMFNNLKMIGYSKALKTHDLNPKKDYYMDITSVKASKMEGIKVLLNYLQIDVKNSAACGDGINDVEMIKNVGLGVAMGNALNDVKEVADLITLTNDENGVAFFINQILKEKF